MFDRSDIINPKTFGQITEEWLDLLSPQLKLSSVVKYTNMLNSYILPEFAGRNITEISRMEMQAFVNKCLISGGKDGSGLSPKTVTGLVSLLNNIFNYALHNGYEVTNLHGISVRQYQKPMRILSRAEQRKLSEYLYINMNPCSLGIIVCLYTGLRIGEICALKWEDVLFDEQCIYVNRTMQRLQTRNNKINKTMVVVSSPKSDCSIRYVPVPENLFNLLGKLRKSENVYLLTGRDDKFMEPRTLQNRFKTITKDCGIENINFHVLRHTFATRCVELGFDIKSLSEILGHSSVNITLNRYVHPSMELKQKNMNKLSELFVV